MKHWNGKDLHLSLCWKTWHVRSGHGRLKRWMGRKLEPFWCIPTHHHSFCLQIYNPICFCQLLLLLRREMEQFFRVINCKMVGINMVVFVLFVCLEFIVPLENFSLIWRRLHCRWRAANFDLCSALMANAQWGFFNVPHLLRHGHPLYNGHLWGPVTLTPVAERLAVELLLPVFTT